jgi:hypothetical protein
MTRRIKGIWGSFAILLFISMASSAMAQFFNFASTGSLFFTNGVAAATPYPSLLYVGTNGAASLPGTIQTVSITLSGFNCKVTQDVSVMLVAPNGTAFEVMSDAGGTVAFNFGNLTLSDSATSAMPMSPFVNGSYKPTSWSCGSTYPSPAPGVHNSAAPCGTETLTSEFASVVGGLSPNGTWQLFLANQQTGTSGSATSWSLSFTITPPALAVTCYHTNNFFEAETGAQYFIGVTNAGLGPTGGTNAATVVDTLPTGLTPTAVGGSGWSCVISNQTVICTQTNQTAAGTSYPLLTLTVNVGQVTLTSLTNTVTLTGSSDGTHTVNDYTAINPPNAPNSASNTLIDVDFITNSASSHDGGVIFGSVMSGAAVLGEAGNQWNAILVSSGTGIHLNYANGSNSPVTMTFASGGGYIVYSYSGTTPFAGLHYGALMENYLYNAGVLRTITLSGLAANSLYNLVLYNAGDAAAAGRTTFFTVNSITQGSTWDAASDTLIAGTDYVEFPSAMSDELGNLAITWTGNGTAEGDINGLQIQPAAPRLGISPAGQGSASVFWPITGNTGNYVLQTNKNLVSTNWGNFSGSVTTANGTNSITVAPAAGDVFFRLKQ